MKFSPFITLFALPVILAVLAPQLSLAEEDCDLATRYHRLSEEAAKEYRQREAYDFLERAVEVCPTYDYWQELGEAAVEFGEVELTKRAAIAYGNALELAQSNSEQARSIGKHAELLFLNGDPQKALTEGYRARNLDPSSAWIDKLVRDIDQRIHSVAAVDIKRGLEDSLFAPLPLMNKVNEKTIAAQSGAGSTGAVAKSASNQAKSINIPINFEFGSTKVDATTRDNIRVLADTLAGPDYSENNFILIGHADTRGDASTNMMLSLERANAIYASILELHPALKGRISTRGKGETEPLSLGNTEFDHRANRRLQVVLQP